MSLINEFYEYMEAAFPVGKSYSYTVWKKDLNSGKLSHKEHLDNEDELQDWMDKSYGKHVTVLVRQDQTKKQITYTDDGEKYVIIDRKK